MVGVVGEEEECGDCKLQTVLQTTDLQALSSKERQLAEQCFTSALWRWALPGSTLGVVAVHLVTRPGALGARLVSRRGPRFALSLVGGMVGYYAASHRYVHSGECLDSFYKMASQGEVGCHLATVTCFLPPVTYYLTFHLPPVASPPAGGAADEAAAHVHRLQGAHGPGGPQIRVRVAATGQG